MKAKEDLLVEMRDGVELSVDVYLPDGDGPWPVVLNCYPYHKDALLQRTLYPLFKRFTGSGYAYVVADCRGTGASGGVTREPLDCLNGDDLYDLIEWCGSQDWSDGNVGMWGSSYGGMTSLKAATVKPPSLKAIVPIMAPSYFYQLAFPGGLLNMLGLCGAWLALMNVMNLTPPLRLDKEGRWKRIWEEHLESFVPYLTVGLEHPTYDDYWKSCEIPLELIETPIYVIEGWYTFSVPDAIAQYQLAKGPKKLLVGPWTHFDPNMCGIEPIDHLYEVTRWFDYWLKGEENGVMDEPPVTICVLGSYEWKYENEWPISRAQTRTYYLSGDGRLLDAPPASESEIPYKYDPSTGITAGLKTVFPLGIDYPKDQRYDDSHSLTFDSDPLDSDVEVTGEPELTLTVSSDVRDIGLVAKICDVAPDRSSTLATTGWLRLSHRHGHERPVPVKPGEVNQVKVKLWPISYLFRKGHRVRLSISCSDFPRVFPLVVDGSITLHVGGRHVAELKLPVIPPGGPKGKPSFMKPDLSFLQEAPIVMIPEWRVVQDHLLNRLSVESGVIMEFTPEYLDGPYRYENHYHADITANDPATAEIHANTSSTFKLAGKEYHINAVQVMTQSKLTVTAKITVNGETVFEKTFEKEHRINYPPGD